MSNALPQPLIAGPSLRRYSRTRQILFALTQYFADEHLVREVVDILAHAYASDGVSVETCVWDVQHVFLPFQSCTVTSEDVAGWIELAYQAYTEPGYDHARLKQMLRQYSGRTIPFRGESELASVADPCRRWNEWEAKIAMIRLLSREGAYADGPDFVMPSWELSMRLEEGRPITLTSLQAMLHTWRCERWMRIRPGRTNGYRLRWNED